MRPIRPYGAQTDTGRTIADFTPSSPRISQETAYAMLGALKLAVKLMDTHGAGVFGILGNIIRNAEAKGDREARHR